MHYAFLKCAFCGQVLHDGSVDNSFNISNYEEGSKEKKSKSKEMNVYFTTTI